MAAIGQVVSFLRGLLHHRHGHFEVLHYPLHRCRLHRVRAKCLSFSFLVTCVVKHISVSRHCLYEDHTPHFVSAQVILGFGLGPAFCPLSDSGKGALGGATPSAFRGGANRAVFVIIPSELETYL